MGGGLKPPPPGPPAPPRAHPASAVRRIKASGPAPRPKRAATVDGTIMDSVSPVLFGRRQPLRREALQISVSLRGPYERLGIPLLRRGQVRRHPRQLERGGSAVSELDRGKPHLLERGAHPALRGVHPFGGVIQLTVRRADAFLERSSRRDHPLLRLFHFSAGALMVPRPGPKPDRDAEREPRAPRGEIAPPDLGPGVAETSVEVDLVR